MKSDKITLFNSENLRKTADFEVPPSLISVVVHRTVCMEELPKLFFNC